MEAKFCCEECGRPFTVDPDSGVANHLTDDGTVDYEADADHVPYGEDPSDGETGEGEDDEPFVDPWEEAERRELRRMSGRFGDEDTEDDEE